MRNKIAIVSGASKGIGAAIVTKLADLDFRVFLVDIIKPESDLLKKLKNPSHHQFITCDITEELQVESLFNSVVKDSGQINVLVNNAGIIRDNLIVNMPVADFKQVIHTNLFGTWLMCRQAAIHMREQKSGSIINISSRAWLGNRGQTNYSASKAGVIGLTRSLALELGKYNVSVNAVAPGLIDTPMTKGLRPDVLENLIGAQPTKTIGKPSDVANAVAFLANPDTSFITGQTIYVDGGKSIGANIS